MALSPSVHMAVQGPHQIDKEVDLYGKARDYLIKKAFNNNLYLFSFSFLKYFYFYDILFTLVVQSLQISHRWMVLQFREKRMLVITGICWGVPLPSERKELRWVGGLGQVVKLLSVTFTSGLLPAFSWEHRVLSPGLAFGAPMLYFTCSLLLAGFSRTCLEIRN